MLLRKGKITMHSPRWPTNARARGTRLAVLSALLACGVLLAMLGLPWVLRERRPVHRELEAALRTLAD